MLKTVYSRFTLQRCWYIICRVYIPKLLQLNAPILTFQISTLNHFLSNNYVYYLSTQTLSDLSAVAWGYNNWEFGDEGEDCSSGLVSSGECNAVSLGVLFDCCDFEIRQSAFGGEGCIDVLDYSCFVSPGVRGWGGVEDNGQTCWMVDLAWVGQGFGPGGSGHGLDSLLACKYSKIFALKVSCVSVCPEFSCGLF